MKKTMYISKVKIEDADAITQLLNTAYRGESSRQGWTTEANILGGLRTTINEIVAITQRDDAFMLKGTIDNNIVATICCELQTNNVENTVRQKIAHFGMIAVAPNLQNKGYGKKIIQAAELITLRRWQINVYQMAVITIRHELIAFYARLDYLPNDEFKQFPKNASLWQPKVAGLQLQYLVKSA